MSRVLARGGLRWCVHSLAGVVCRGHAQYPAFATNSLFLLLALQKWQLGVFLAFLYPVVHNLPQLRMLAVIFSPLEYLSVLLLEETFVQV